MSSDTRSKNMEAPRRAKSAFTFYSDAHRERVKQENPDAPLTRITEILASEWKALSDNEKKPYLRQAAVDSQHAEQERAASGVDDEDEDE